MVRSHYDKINLLHSRSQHHTAPYKLYISPRLVVRFSFGLLENKSKQHSYRERLVNLTKSIEMDNDQHREVERVVNKRVWNGRVSIFVVESFLCSIAQCLKSAVNFIMDAISFEVERFHSSVQYVGIRRQHGLRWACVWLWKEACTSSFGYVLLCSTWFRSVLFCTIHIVNINLII